MYIVDDRHGLWQLLPLHGFKSDGTLLRGCYFKKADSTSEALPTLHLVTSLITLEATEEFASEPDPVERGNMLRRPDGKYRGAMTFTAIEETDDFNFGELYNRMEQARNAYDQAYADTVDPDGPPVEVVEPSGGEGVAPVEGNQFHPADTDQSGDVSKQERKKWNAEHPDNPIEKN